jgi:hypothetical protein
MKRVIVLIAGLVLMIAPAALAFQGSIGSGEQSGSTAIKAGACHITAVHQITDGTNNCKVIIYDNASAASGTVRYEATIKGANHFGGRVWTQPKKMYNGIYAVGTGAGCTYIVEYIEED